MFACSGVVPIIAPPEYVDISLASLATYVEELDVIVQHPNTTMQTGHETCLNHSFAQDCAGPHLCVCHAWGRHCVGVGPVVALVRP